MLIPGQTLSLRIEKPAAGGRMIARSDSGVILVSGAIPGEQITARVERIGQGVAYAATTAVEEASPDRRSPFTDPLCGGCLYAHIAYPRQLEIKSKVIAYAFARIGRIPLGSVVPVAASPVEGYRMRARLHVRVGRAGFFREGSHEVCDARATRQLLPETCDVLDAVAASLRQVNDDIVGELEVSENVDASQRVVHIDTAAPPDPALLSSLRQVAGLTGLTMSPAQIVAGDPHVVDALAILGQTVTLRRHVLAFFQGNRFLLGDLVSHVVGHIESGANVIDLYAGAGLFSIAAAVARNARVTAVEGDRTAAGDLKTNAASLNGAVKAVHQPVEAFVTAARTAPAVVIVDPPRTGLSKEAVRGVVALRPHVVVYVSCDVPTLARDARRLLDDGYGIKTIDAFDLFPNTPHVETVAVFERP
jgi:23S rRNA (uracil1939-C5)-methyltransferase